MTEHAESHAIGKEPCPDCSSTDNLIRYSDGHAYCFSIGCGRREPPTDGGEVRSGSKQSLDFKPLGGDVQALENRGITRETCEVWNYRVLDLGDHVNHIANFKDAHGNLCGQKVRKPGKQFSWNGEGSHLLYGMWLWGGGKSITITEGEIDALTVSQCFQNKWPVVSLPNGAKNAAKVLAKNYEYLNAFESIVLMFDQDEPGRLATDEAALVLPFGKVKIAVLPKKDANETLLEVGAAAVTKAFWNAKPWKPGGIVAGSEMTLDALMSDVTVGYELPYPKFYEMTGGLRKGELTMLTAGTGIGKSTWAREIAYYLHQRYGLKLGNVYLEEKNSKTAQAYIAIHNNVALKDIRRDPTCLPREAWERGFNEVVKERMWFFDHFGSLDSDNLVNKLRYLAVVCGVDFIVLDHISIVISGQESSRDGERKDIDRLMSRLVSLINETGVGIIAITHLNQPDGTPHEEGGRVTLRHLRGSGSLKQLSWNVVALERDQQGDNPTQSTIRLLKCRETGETGEADHLIYDRSTGRLEAAVTSGL